MGSYIFGSINNELLYSSSKFNNFIFLNIAGFQNA